MWVLTFFTLQATLVYTSEIVPGLHRSVSDRVTSKGFQVMYGDEDLTIINEVVTDMEKNDLLKPKVNLNEAIKPLHVEEVKCLMSADKYCSKDMRRVKGVLIQALKNECEKCSIDEKENAGRIAAAMMAHDPVAWKLFLTRSALQERPSKKPYKPEEVKLKYIGEPEIIESKYRFTMPGYKVRVKRYNAEKIP